MPENILVVEYEPRYTDRVKQALSGQPIAPSFARDGEEALRVLGTERPRLIVLSSVVPKISTAELIRAIRNQDALAKTPILLTVSGYTGKSPKQDALRLGVSDILPKPYSESEFLGKVQQMLGLNMVRPTPAENTGTLTSNEIFGELLDEDRAGSPGAKKMKPTDDVDKMLADTLAGVMPQKKKDAAPPAAQPPKPAPAPAAPPPPPPAAEAKPKPAAAKGDYDKMLEDTLSGLEKTARKPSTGQPARPAAPAAAPAPPQSLKTEKIPVLDKVPVSQPIFPPAATPTPASHEEDEPTDGVKFGQYVLVEKIATGGMAEVWKARMRGVEGFQKIVAIKKILPHLSDNQDFIEMFIDEAKLAAQLNHNNIIHIYDLGKIQSSYYIAMEYVDGYDLKTILKQSQERDQPMQVELALFIASKVAAALDYAHRKRDFEDRDMGLVHRDVSPQNVLISEEGDIKLCDFGIAKAASKASHTQAGALKGKLQYMSPEQAWGRHIDKRSDVFALATVLFEMLTGRKLFAGDNELSILEQVREARVVAPSQFNDEVTPEIDAIVLKALEKEPEKRYQTAGEMARDLDQILYTFKPTPTSADLAIYMHRLEAAPAVPVHEPQPEPVVEAKPAPAAAPAPVAAAAAAPAAVAMPPFERPAEAQSDASFFPEPSKKTPVVPIVVAAVVVLAILGGWLMTRGKSAPQPNAAAPAASTAAAAGVPAATAATESTASTAPTATAPGTQAPLVDAAQVAAEVRKRMEAERQKLEAQNRSQQTAETPRAAATQTTATQAAAAPVTPQPQPAAPVPQPQPQVAESRPAPAAPAPQPEAPRTREGDLVQPGAEGLTPARMTRQAAPVYPPIARAQRMQGTVIVSVLVNEDGAVTDTRVIRGGSFGLTEAALQAVRRSQFAPGTKDGVRVKSWTTVEINFKL